jgi:hypothetical protein
VYAPAGLGPRRRRQGPLIQRLEAAAREGNKFAAEDLLAEVEKLRETSGCDRPDPEGSVLTLSTVFPRLITIMEIADRKQS